MWNLQALLNDLGIEERDHPAHLLDFDLAHLEFWEWFESMREQKKKVSVPASMRLKDHQTWGPKWTDQEILNRYADRRISNGPVSDDITDEQLWSVMDDWDIDEIPESM